MATMVRRIRTCSRCQRRFTSASGEFSCRRCCREREQLNAVLPRSVSSPPDSLPVDHAGDQARTFEDTENPPDDSELPANSKRRKPTHQIWDTSKTRPGATTAASTVTASSASLRKGECGSESDSDNDVLLSNLFQRVGGVRDPAALDDASKKHQVNQSPKVKEQHAVANTTALDNSTRQKHQAWETEKCDSSTNPILLDCNESSRLEHASEPSLAAADDTVCFICGSDFKHLSTGLKGRLNHLKRCSKKHGVSARDIKLNDDCELFVTDSTPTRSAMDTSKDSWHRDAAIDLALASGCESSATYFQKEDLVNQKEPAVAKKASSKQTTMGNFFQMPVRSLNNVLLAGARRVAKRTEILAAPNKFASGAASRGKRKRVDFSKLSCPKYKKIPGTDFVCDGFMYAKSCLTRNYFLTHFHSDHYGGITKHWNAGIIYCSIETANLVHQQLGVDRKYLHPLGIMTPTIVESNGKPVSVTLMDANHCPGAVMFLFEVGKRRILHVGDFRWNREQMTRYAPLRAFSTLQYRLDDLFLDTTYCDEKYTLPTQAEAIQATVELAESEWQRSKGRVLFLFGAYTIGKERIYLSVAERLRCKVLVDKSRYRVLSALNWPRERMSMLTTNKEESNLWVVPLGHINFKRMQPYLGGSDKVFSKKKYDRIVGFRPTGWSLTARGSSIVSSQTRGSFTVHGIPYSEHSSFNELIDCLDCLKPKRIIPTVSATKSDEQVHLLLRNLSKQQGR